MDMIVQGVIAACTLLYLFSYFDIRRILGYAFIVDIAATALFIFMFAGSFGGMMTGVIAGLCVSGFLRVARRFLGAKRLRLMRAKGRILPTFRWVSI